MGRGVRPFPVSTIIYIRASPAMVKNPKVKKYEIVGLVVEFSKENLDASFSPV